MQIQAGWEPPDVSIADVLIISKSLMYWVEIVFVIIVGLLLLIWINLRRANKISLDIRECMIFQKAVVEEIFFPECDKLTGSTYEIKKKEESKKENVS